MRADFGNRWLMMAGLVLASLVLSLPVAAEDLWSEQAITLETDSGQLQGSLMLPAGGDKVAKAAKWPVVLIVAGSGPTDRNGNSLLLHGPNNSLKMLAEGLAQAGWASVRYDKRGVGSSKAAFTREENYRIENYVQDVADWVKKLRADPRFSSVVLLGHSEGSLLSILAAEQVRVDALVSVAGAGQNMADIFRFQLRGKLLPVMVQKNEQILRSLQAGETVSDLPSPLDKIYRPSVQPYLISMFHYTPSQELGKLTIPVLIVQGDNDIQVEIRQADELKRGQPAAQLLIVRGMNHVLKIVGTDRASQLSSYSEPDLPLATPLLTGIDAFLRSSLPATTLTQPKPVAGTSP
ncbi:MAG: alpha/beta fold hydrolase [Burkholderiales bacterium]|nr:alpha/beta fold hydrolase [Burkholderiales bacterium]